MDEGQALELINNYLSEIRFGPEIYENGDGDLIDTLSDFAIPAMEKEIAGDVAVEVSISRREYYACPNCTDFIKWRFDANRDNYEPGRCPGCGQTLNWRI